MRYVRKEHLPEIFDIVRRNYGRNEEVPIYETFPKDIAKLLGVFDGVQNDLYLTVAQKASYLFLQINKGHFFPNGNKRLAVVVTLVFILINGFRIKKLGRDEYKFLLEKIFPLYKDYIDFKDFFPEEFALYNISIIVAESHKYENNFDTLKKSVEAFFEFSMIRTSEQE